MKKYIKAALLEIGFCVLFFIIARIITDRFLNGDTLPFFLIIMMLNIIRGVFEYAVVVYGKDVRVWWIIFNKKNFISWDDLYRMAYSDVFLDNRMRVQVEKMLAEFGIPPTDYYYHVGRGLYFRKDHLRTLFLLKYGS